MKMLIVSIRTRKRGKRATHVLLQADVTVCANGWKICTQFQAKVINAKLNGNY